MKREQVRQSRRAFSLIELLIVILIIALVVAILLPALGSVRGKSREAATRNLMANLSQSISMFEQAEKRLPGVFSAKEMGANANQGEGFSALNNVLLDLAGGVTSQTTLGAVQIGPMTNSGVYFHGDLVGKIGAGKAYFTPPVANWKQLNGGQYGTKTASAGNMEVNELVDAEGMPILAWMQDPMAVGPIDAIADIARQASNGQEPSRFYQNSNWVFLKSDSLGKKGVNQYENSMIGGGAGTNALINLGGMLGAPGSPQKVNSVSLNNILPSAPRGSFVLQSAGRNGVYLGKSERGASRAAAGGTILYYGLNHKDASDNPLLDANGTATSSDILKDFDDIVMAGS